MENKPTYTLDRTERLKSRKAIEQLFADGKSFSLFPFKVIYKKAIINDALPITNNKQQITNTNLQTAFSVSKRYFKKAVHRNRIKRLMREAYRLQKNDLQTCLQQSNKSLVVFIIYLSNELPEYGVVMEKLNAVLRRLKKITDEETVAHT